MASEVMIDVEDPNYDWQGHLPKRCFSCLQNGPQGARFQGSEHEARKEFNKLSAHRRLNRRIQRGEQVQKRARTLSWQQALRDIEREHGLSTAAWRKQVGDRAKQFAVSVFMAFARGTPEVKAMMVRGLHRFTDNMKKAADDPDLIPKLEYVFHEHAADNLDEIVHGVEDYYLCRRKGCLFVGPNTHWIISSTEGQFRCPDCGERYFPWKKIEGSDTFIPAQKILIFDKGDDFRFLPQAVLSEFGSMVDPRDVEMVLTLWPDTTTQNLINEFKAEAPIASSLGHWFSCLCKFILFFA